MPERWPADWRTQRPSLWRQTILDAWQNAVKASCDGKVRSPGSGDILDPPHLENGNLVKDWEMGHVEGHEWRRALLTGIIEGWDWEKMTRLYNEAEHYFPESKVDNVTHEGESKDIWIYNGLQIK